MEPAPGMGRQLNCVPGNTRANLATPGSAACGDWSGLFLSAGEDAAEADANPTGAYTLDPSQAADLNADPSLATDPNVLPPDVVAALTPTTNTTTTTTTTTTTVGSTLP